MSVFNIKTPMDWDAFWGNQTFQPLSVEKAQTTCDGCEAGCEDGCIEASREELRIALADAAIELSTATRVLSELIDRIYGEV